MPAPPPRIQIENVQPMLDGGRYAAKRTVGEEIEVSADIFRDGHDVLKAVVRHRAPGARRWDEEPMRRIDAHVDGDRWAGSFTPDVCGDHHYTVAAWTDVFASWRDELRRKVEAGEPDLSGELSEGVVLLEDALARAKGEDARLIGHAVSTLRDASAPQLAQTDAALGPELLHAMERHAEHHGATELEKPLRLDVDRRLARFGSWYELFPRSFGGLKGVRKALPELADLGFDVVYLPPIHPIGETNRKGRNNALKAKKGDPGSPWAIGHREHGGHDAVHPDLGTLEDVRELTAAARDLNIDIALDLAIQCSADHPWLTDHPEWFNRRPDGTLKYAENPPKKYQDIYNVNWESEDWKGLWEAILRVVLHWVDHGVQVFRVDNPHTKPLPFWEWLIAEVRKDHPDVIFLAEAFTRRAMMRTLAKLGFDQSYTYFTWKNARWELEQYVGELAYSGEQEYFRPNFFANTPDILNAYLQNGGRPAFEARLVLAATLSPTYGIYSGFEHCENVPVREGSEEYLDSEKYEVRKRKLDGPLLPLVKRVNEIRRENVALQRLSNVWFLDTRNDGLIAYLKRDVRSGNVIVTVVCIDPRHAQEGLVDLPGHIGLPPEPVAHDLLTGERFAWRIGENYVRLVPGERQAHILRIEPR